MLWSLCRDICPWESAFFSQSPARTFNAFLLLYVLDQFSVKTGRNDGTKTENDNVLLKKKKKKKNCRTILNQDINRANSQPQEKCCYLLWVQPLRRNLTTNPNQGLVIYFLVVLIFYILLTATKITLYLYEKKWACTRLKRVSSADVGSETQII